MHNGVVGKEEGGGRGVQTGSEHVQSCEQSQLAASILAASC